MVDNSEEKFLGQRGSYLIIEFINIINLKVLGGGMGLVYISLDWTSLHLPFMVLICYMIVTVILLCFRVLAFVDVVSAV